MVKKQSIIYKIHIHPLNNIKGNWLRQGSNDSFETAFSTWKSIEVITKQTNTFTKKYPIKIICKNPWVKEKTKTYFNVFTFPKLMENHLFKKKKNSPPLIYIYIFSEMVLWLNEICCDNILQRWKKYIDEQKKRKFIQSFRYTLK